MGLCFGLGSVGLRLRGRTGGECVVEKKEGDEPGVEDSRTYPI